ncbi:MAG: cbb3-type cytochrome c oxidase subunit II [Anaerolineae bacterium]
MRLSVSAISWPEKAILLIIPSLVVGVFLLVGQSFRASPYATLGQQGHEVFRREGCFFCHSMEGRELTAEVSPLLGLVRSGPDLLFEAGLHTDDWHLAHLLNPKAINPRSAMPSYAHLSDQEMKALIAFLQEVRGQPSPTPAPTREAFIPEVPRTLEAYQAGRRIYQENCGGCHGSEGNGSGSVGHLLVPEPRDFTNALWMSKQTDLYLFTVITDGKSETAMPGYRELLSAQERSLVLQFIRYYAHPSRRQAMEEGLPSGVPSGF